ncbi:MAG: hypothetical protein IKT65_03450 [Clostridia bacterium]|nr:hypothetical protein [Clostridia bacterium]
MRGTKRNGNFILCLLINLILNFEKSVPAWILLIAHYVFDIPIFWFWIALACWILSIAVWMGFIRTAVRFGNEPTPYRKNKNPYSAKGAYTDNDKQE